MLPRPNTALFVPQLAPYAPSPCARPRRCEPSSRDGRDAGVEAAQERLPSATAGTSSSGAFAGCVSCPCSSQGRYRDDRRIHDGALRQLHAVLLQVLTHRGEQLIGRAMLLLQVPELARRRFTRRALAPQVDACEPAHVAESCSDSSTAGSESTYTAARSGVDRAICLAAIACDPYSGRGSITGQNRGSPRSTIDRPALVRPPTAQVALLPIPLQSAAHRLSSQDGKGRFLLSGQPRHHHSIPCR